MLEDLHQDPEEQDAFIAMVLESTSLEGFKFVDAPIDGHEGCLMINIMIHCLIISEDTRRAFLLEEQPQADFEPDELISWEGMVLAIQFAGYTVLDTLIRKLPPEFIAFGIDSLPEEAMKKYARQTLRCAN